MRDCTYFPESIDIQEQYSETIFKALHLTTLWETLALPNRDQKHPWISLLSMGKDESDCESCSHSNIQPIESQQ